MGVPGRLSGRGDDGELRLKGKAVRPEEAGVLVVGGGLLLALLCCALIGCKIDCGGGRSSLGEPTMPNPLPWGSSGGPGRE